MLLVSLWVVYVYVCVHVIVCMNEVNTHVYGNQSSVLNIFLDIYPTCFLNVF